MLRGTGGGIIPLGMAVARPTFRASGLAVALVLPESGIRSAGGRIDLVGAALLGLGVTLPLLAVRRGNAWGWTSGRVLALLAAGPVVLVVFGLVERPNASPPVDLRLLAQPAVLVTNATTALVGICMFGAFMLVPQLAQASVSTGYGFGVDATRGGPLLAVSRAAIESAPRCRERLSGGGAGWSR
ncbi:hypothetical protein AB0A95_18650 [Micromonospora sp. NPDC049230]|uniref:hypothetical protein n=1 Tax=Micromonospora sp. NPDC049230 TaxID=3155502 RepID=UPI0033DC4F2D